MKTLKIKQINGNYTKLDKLLFECILEYINIFEKIITELKISN